jgi:hypothetical protein
MKITYKYKKQKKNLTKKEQKGGGSNIPKIIKNNTNEVIKNYILKMSKLKKNENKLKNADEKKACLYNILDLSKNELRSIACYKSIHYRNINKLLWYIGEKGHIELNSNTPIQEDNQIDNQMDSNIFTLSNNENKNEKKNKQKHNKNKNSDLKEIKQIYEKEKESCKNIYKAIQKGFTYDKPIIVFRNFSNIQNIPKEIDQGEYFNGFISTSLYTDSGFSAEDNTGVIIIKPNTPFLIIDIEGERELLLNPGKLKKINRVNYNKTYGTEKYKLGIFEYESEISPNLSTFFTT